MFADRHITVSVLFALVLLIFPAVVMAEGPEEVSFETLDGYTLVGDLYMSDRGSPVMFLLHGLGSDSREFYSLGLLLQRNGFHALAYDARGHGRSTKRDGKEVGWRDLEEELLADMVMDVEAAAGFMRDRLGSAGGRLGLAGSAFQANIALVYAARHAEVGALVMFSPGLSYYGVNTETPMSTYAGRPVFMVAAKGDEYSFRSMNRLMELAGDDKISVELTGDAHGARMLDTAPSLILKVEDWLGRRLK